MSPGHLTGTPENNWHSNAMGAPEKQTSGGRARTDRLSQQVEHAAQVFYATRDADQTWDDAPETLERRTPLVGASGHRVCRRAQDGMLTAVDGARRLHDPCRTPTSPRTFRKPSRCLLDISNSAMASSEAYVSPSMRGWNWKERISGHLSNSWQRLPGWRGSAGSARRPPRRSEQNSPVTFRPRQTRQSEFRSAAQLQGVLQLPRHDGETPLNQAGYRASLNRSRTAELAIVQRSFVALPQPR